MAKYTIDRLYKELRKYLDQGTISLVFHDPSDRDGPPDHHISWQPTSNYGGSIRISQRDLDLAKHPDDLVEVWALSLKDQYRAALMDERKAQ